MRAARRLVCVLATVLVAVGLLGAASANAAAAPLAGAGGWGVPSSLAHPRSAARRLMAARLRRAERASIARHGGPAARSRRRAQPDLTSTAIAGTVTDAATKEGVTGVEVCAYEVEGIERGFYEEGEAEPVCGTSGEAGAYELPVLAGEYYVEFFDPSRNYVPQLYDDKTFAENPDPVLVSPDQVTEDIDAALVKGGSIEGAVTAQEGGAPLSGILACAFDFEVGGLECEETGSAGSFRIRGLPSGSYAVAFLVPPVPGENYLDGSLEGVEVTAGVTTSGVSAALRTGGEIEGTVTAVASGAPIHGVYVCTTPSIAFFEEEEEVCTRTGPAGTYTVERLEPGAYFVEFFGLPVYATQFYNGSTYGTPLGSEAVPLSVLPPVPRTGIDAEMLRVGEEPPRPVASVIPASTGAPGGAVLPAKIVVPAAAAGSRVHVTGHRASVALSCAIGPCRGTVQLTITVTRRHRVNGHTVTRRVRLLVGSGSFSLAQGASGKVTIHLSGQGAKLLATAARHPRAGRLGLVLHGANPTQRAVIVR